MEVQLCKRRVANAHAHAVFVRVLVVAVKNQAFLCVVTRIGNKIINITKRCTVPNREIARRASMKLTSMQWAQGKLSNAMLQIMLSTAKYELALVAARHGVLSGTAMASRGL